MNRSSAVYIASFSLMALLAAMVSGVFLYIRYTAFIGDSLEQTMTRAASTVLKLYDLGDQEGLWDAGINGDPEFQETLEDLNIFANEYEFAYIYTLLYKGSGDFYFVYDTGNLDRDKKKGSYFSMYYNYPPSLLRAVVMDEIQISEAYTDEWGHFKAIYVPLHDEAGNVTGALGMDYEVSRMELLYREAGFILLISILTALLIALILSRLLSPYLARPYEAARMSADRSHWDYRRLFDESPIALWEEDYSGVKSYLNSIRDRGIRDIRAYLKENEDEVYHCLDLLRVTDVNSAVLKLMEVDKREYLLGPLSSQDHVRASSFIEELATVWEGIRHKEWELEFTNNGGVTKTVMLNWTVTRSAGDDYSRVIVAMTDLSEIKEYQKSLQNSQRMKAMGHLASGIAHDFNNILGGIMGYAELSMALMTEKEVPPELPSYMQNIFNASLRARDLVKRILSFSRKGDDSNTVLLLSPVMKEVSDLLIATFPSSVNFRVEIDEAPLKIWGNESRLHELVMNLAGNASQAMNREGDLTISLGKYQERKGQSALLGNLEIGDYALIEVRDTGEGIPDSIREKIFEPFFTTRKKEEGSGLGLSIVYGVLKDAKGNIRVSSTPGEGSVFSVYLPLYVDPEE